MGEGTEKAPGNEFMRTGEEQVHSWVSWWQVMGENSERTSNNIQ